jgi:hypothetical protein
VNCTVHSLFVLFAAPVSVYRLLCMWSVLVFTVTFSRSCYCKWQRAHKTTCTCTAGDYTFIATTASAVVLAVTATDDCLTTATDVVCDSLQCSVEQQFRNLLSLLHTRCAATESTCTVVSDSVTASTLSIQCATCTTTASSNADFYAKRDSLQTVCTQMCLSCMAAVAATLLVMYSSAVLPCSAVLQQQLRVHSLLLLTTLYKC